MTPQKDEDEIYGRKRLQCEPDWLTGDMGNYPICREQTTPQFDKKRVGYSFPAKNVAATSALTGGKKSLVKSSEENTPKPIQQSDLLKPLLMDIIKKGLPYAYENYKNIQLPGESVNAYMRDEDVTDVIIIGAGMAGLAAAYELSRAGLKVAVVEQTTRVGGRVHTLGTKDGLENGLYGEAGAMRLPCSATTLVSDMTHFLTDTYIDKFNLEIEEFLNYNENAFLKFYNEPATPVKDWDDNLFDKLWPGWDKTIKGKDMGITNIDEYYDRTTKIVTDQLRRWLQKAEEGDDVSKAIQWKRWIDIWCQFTLEGFLQSTYKAVLTKIPDRHDQEGLEELASLLPWPDAAVRAYSVFSYTEQLDQSLVQYLRDQLGQWWSPNMHRIKSGMSKLPEAFAEKLEGKIRFNRRVNEIVYTFDESNPVMNRVEIKGYYTSSKRSFPTIVGRAAIVTTPINLLRQITFTAKPDTATPPPPQEFYQAIEDIFTGPSTKIFIQTKTRFWEKGDHPIKGGFSKTNLPIGQIHYVTNDDSCHDDREKTEKGLLLIYTWKSEALLFGSLDPDIAVKEAVEQIAIIHKDIEEEFELGLVHAWYDQPSAQGAYGLLKPNQFKNVRWLWKPMCNLYFAGETFSTASGWIQGALESGLKAAYQFYVRYRNSSNSHT